MQVLPIHFIDLTSPEKYKIHLAQIFRNIQQMLKTGIKYDRKLNIAKGNILFTDVCYTVTSKKKQQHTVKRRNFPHFFPIDLMLLTLK